MTDLHVLQAARSNRRFREAQRRRRRRRKRALRGLVVALLGVAILLVVLARSAGPTTAHTKQATRAAARLPPTKPIVPRPVYGRIADAVQVNPRIMLPLRSGLLFDVNTGRVLWSRNPNVRLPIASLTKMMTALVVAAHSKPSNKVMITKQALDYTGSGVGLLPLHKRVPEKALLYGLLLPSGNDAAIALAVHVARTQPRFVAMMNAQARKMGLGCSHFSNVSGVVDQDNYSCATDLAVLAHAVLTNRTLAPIVASPSAILPFPIKGGKLFLYNNNPLLEINYPGTDGVKTGYTTAAGLCLVAAAKRGHVWLAVVLLHMANWETQATQLLNAGFAALR
jgi:serine-type D-Ala-D-Ala carboxypeptidase (penicillin-binding protein 5/6)